MSTEIKGRRRRLLDDIVGRLFGELLSLEAENGRLRRLVSLLLHYKYMLGFVRDKWMSKNPSGDNDLAKFEVDYVDCGMRFQELIHDLDCVKNFQSRHPSIQAGENVSNYSAFNDPPPVTIPVGHFTTVMDNFRQTPLNVDNVLELNRRKLLFSDEDEEAISDDEEDHNDHDYVIDYHEPESSVTESDSEPLVNNKSRDTQISNWKRSISSKLSTVTSLSTKSSSSSTKGIPINVPKIKQTLKRKTTAESAKNPDIIPAENIRKSARLSAKSRTEVQEQRKTRTMALLADSPLFKLKAKSRQRPKTTVSTKTRDLTTEIESAPEIPELSPSDCIVIDHSRFAQPELSVFFEEIADETGGKRYECRICQFGHNIRTFMVSHVLKHFALQPYECSHCDFRSDNRKYLLRHVSSQHNFTSEIFYYMDYFISTPVPEDGGMKFDCKLRPNCPFEAREIDDLWRHFTDEHFPASPFKCAHCGDRFRDLSTIRQHLTQKHRPYGKSLREKKARAVCPYGYCGFLIEKQEDGLNRMLDHIKAEHEFVQNPKKRDLDEDDASSVDPVDDLEDEYEQDYVTRRKRTKADDDRDVENEDEDDQEDEEIVEEEINHECSYRNCQFSSRSWTQVKAHEYRRHMRTLRFKCPQVDCTRMEEFDTKAELAEHLLVVHDISAHRCGIDGCRSSFENGSLLKQHMKTSHTVAYLTCAHCQKLYKSRVNMLKHYRQQHVEGEFQCPVCDYTARTKAELRNHRNTSHVKLKRCPVDGCGAQIQSGQLFQLHMNRHLNVKNHPCSWPECGKMFVDRKSLTDHLRIHLNYKRFRCRWPGCGYAAEQRSNTIKHIRIKHLGLPYTKKQQEERNIISEERPQKWLEILPELEELKIG